MKIKTQKVKVKGTKLFEWQERATHAGECEKCHRFLPRLTVDHIIPVSILERLDEGREIAVNDEDNFQLICGPCNMLKSSQIDITNPKTARNLVKYLQPYLKA